MMRAAVQKLTALKQYFIEHIINTAFENVSKEYCYGNHSKQSLFKKLSGCVKKNTAKF